MVVPDSVTRTAVTYPDANITCGNDTCEVFRTVYSSASGSVVDVDSEMPVIALMVYNSGENEGKAIADGFCSFDVNVERGNYVGNMSCQKGLFSIDDVYTRYTVRFVLYSTKKMSLKVTLIC